MTEIVLAYRVQHNCDVSDLLKEYKKILQQAINEIWKNTTWIEKKVKHKNYTTTRLVPRFPVTKEFKNNLRKELMKNWPYAKHYVDSAIKTAYSILSSWRSNYLKGRYRRRKPIVKRNFVRVKTTLMKDNGTNIRITIVPRQEYLTIDYSREWFYPRIKGWKIGEAVLRENDILLTFKNDVQMNGTVKIGIDSNMMSLDIYHPQHGWIRVDLHELHRIAEMYDRIIDGLKSIYKKAPKRIGRLLKKYYSRRRNRLEDYLNKLAVQLSREFPSTVFVFEDLNKSRMFKKGYNKFNRKLSRAVWNKIVQKLSYRVPIEFVNSAYTSTTCPVCGSRMESQDGWVVCPACGFSADRQFVGAFNVYRRGVGVPLSGAEPNDLPFNEPRGGLRVMRPKLVVRVNLNGKNFACLRTNPHDEQTPYPLIQSTSSLQNRESYIQTAHFLQRRNLMK